MKVTMPSSRMGQWLGTMTLLIVHRIDCASAVIRRGTGSPFDLLAPGVEWTIVGSSPLSRTYRGKQEFLDEVIHPFNARMATPLVPSVRGVYADGDMVIIFFDAIATAKDSVPYRNTYTWYFQFDGATVVKAFAFFDTRDFDDFWARVKPQ